MSPRCGTVCDQRCWPKSLCPAASSRCRSTLRACRSAASAAESDHTNRRNLSMLNICMVGHGMMGVWHSEALRLVDDARLHTVVGRPAKPAGESPATPTVGNKPPTTATFAEKYGYKKWTTNLGEALEDPEVDVVIIAGPSETHAEMALASLEHGKHTLVEIPIAMNLDGAERVVAAAKEKGLTLGVVPRCGSDRSGCPSSSGSTAAKSGSVTFRARF